MPMVSIKQDVYVQIIRSLPEGDTDVAAYVNSSLRVALKMKQEAPKDKK